MIVEVGDAHRVMSKTPRCAFDSTTSAYKMFFGVTPIRACSRRVELTLHGFYIRYLKFSITIRSSPALTTRSYRIVRSSGDTSNPDGMPA